MLKPTRGRAFQTPCTIKKHRDGPRAWVTGRRLLPKLHEKGRFFANLCGQHRRWDQQWAFTVIGIDLAGLPSRDGTTVETLIVVAAVASSIAAKRANPL